MAFSTAAFDLVADTPVQVMNDDNHTKAVKMVFVPEDPEADPATICVIAESSAKCSAGDGFPLVQTGSFDTSDLNLAPRADVWAMCTNGDGRLLVLSV